MDDPGDARRGVARPRRARARRRVRASPRLAHRDGHARAPPPAAARATARGAGPGEVVGKLPRTRCRERVARGRGRAERPPRDAEPGGGEARGGGLSLRRFDARALYAAIDRRRTERGLSWADVARATGVSLATIKRTEAGGRMEVDGMLALVGWLGVPVETFVRETSA